MTTYYQAFVIGPNEEFMYEGTAHKGDPTKWLATNKGIDLTDEYNDGGVWVLVVLEM